MFVQHFGKRKATAKKPERRELRLRAVPTIEEPVPVLNLMREAIEKLTEEVRTLAPERSGRVAAIGARTTLRRSCDRVCGQY